MLTYHERKACLKHGDVRRIARAYPCGESFVSSVLTGRRRHRALERFIASRMQDPRTGRGVTVNEAFGPEYRKPTLAPETER